VDMKKILFGGIAFAVIAQVVRTVEAVLTMDYYLDPAYFGTWSKIMMPEAGAPPVEFYIYSVLFALITGIFFAYVYSAVKSALPRKNKGLHYGVLVFFVAGAPFGMTAFLLFNVPCGLLAVWAVTSLVVYLAAGWAVERIAG